MTIWQTIDANAIKRLKEIYDRYNVQRIINAFAMAVRAALQRMAEGETTVFQKAKS